MKRRIFTLLLFGVLVIAGASGASAAPPEDNKKYREITLLCGSDPAITVWSIESQGVAFHHEESGEVFILVSFEFVVDEDTGVTVTVPVGQGNRVGQQNDLITCNTPDLSVVRATFIRVPAGA